MPSYVINEMIEYMLNRKGWQQTYMANLGEHSERSISRIKSQKNAPYLDTFKSYMDTMEMSIDRFFCPYTKNIPANFNIIIEDFLHQIEWINESPSSLDNAKMILEHMCTMGDFNEGLNKQLIISCQILFDLVADKNYNQTIKFANEAILITYPEFSQESFEDQILLFEEPALVHQMAIAYAKNGDTNVAITLLGKLQTSLSRLPQDNRIKGRQLALILLDLSNLLIIEGAYMQALDICDRGYQLSVQCNTGKYCPDLMYNKALLLLHLGKKDEAIKLLNQVYFGFIALRKKNKATQVLECVKDLGKIIDTYETQYLPSHLPDSKYDHGKQIICQNFGKLLKFFREDAGVSVREISKGICDYSVLNKIENNSINGNIYHIESIMQRLGRDIDQHLNTFLSPKDFYEKQLRDKIIMYLTNKQYKEVKPLLAEFKKTKAFKKYKPNQQLALIVEAQILRRANKNGYVKDFIKMLEDAWEITQSKFDEETIYKLRMTYHEISIVNLMANTLSVVNEGVRALHLYESIVTNVKHYYVDEAERVRTYIPILYNYSRQLGLQKRHQKSLDIAIEGEELCIKHFNLKTLPRFMVNRACALFELCEKEKSVPYLVMAHHLSALLGRMHDQKATKKYAREHFNIELD